MKAILKYDLPDEKEAFQLATKAQDMLYMLTKFSDLLRKYDKYDVPEQYKDSDVFVEHLREEFYSMAQDADIGSLL